MTVSNDGRSGWQHSSTPSELRAKRLVFTTVTSDRQSSLFWWNRNVYILYSGLDDDCYYLAVTALYIFRHENNPTASQEKTTT